MAGLAKPFAVEAKPHVVLLSGEKLYDSAVTLPKYAEALEKKFGFRCVVFGWEERPHLDVSHWDGVVGLPSGADQPFYRCAWEGIGCQSTASRRSALTLPTLL